MAFLDPDAVARLVRPRTIVATESLGRESAPVARATLDDGSTVVVKERPRVPNWGNLENERAALEVLGRLPEGDAIGPRFVAGDDDVGVVIMSDVGAGPTIEDLLLDPDLGTEATGALLEHGRALAALHAVTAAPNVHELFLERRHLLGSTYDAAAERVRYSGLARRALWDEVGERAASVGFTPPPAAVDHDADRLWLELAEPGAFLALTTLDANPQNGVVQHDGSVRLVDFEGAAIRHLGLDAAFLRFPFPNYGHWAVLPEPVRSAMEETYREELVQRGVTAAADDGAYARAIAVGAAATVMLRVHRLPRIAEDDDEQVAVRRRTQMTSAIAVLAGACEQARLFPRLAAWFVGLSDEMAARWPECARPPREFPALPLVPEGAAQP